MNTEIARNTCRTQEYKEYREHIIKSPHELKLQRTFSRLATRLSMKSSVHRPEALSSIYVRLNMTLVRANARALLSRVDCSTIHVIIVSFYPFSDVSCILNH